MHSIKKIETDLDLVCLVVPFLMFMKKKWFGLVFLQFRLYLVLYAATFEIPTDLESVYQGHE